MTKNFKGGYKIVSLNGNDLTSESAFTVKGLYEDLADSYSKPILVSEIIIDDEKQQDAYAVVKKTESGYSIEVYGYALTVTDEDAVTSVALPEITSIGEGLDLTDGELSASGGGKLYRHDISMYFGMGTIYWSIRFALITYDNTAFTSWDSITTYCNNAYKGTGTPLITGTGVVKDNTGTSLIRYINVSSSSQVKAGGSNFSDPATELSMTYSTPSQFSITDNVYEV